MSDIANAFIFFNTWAGEDRLNHTVIAGNRLFADAPAKPLLAIVRDNQSVGLVVRDNTSHPYEEPPKAMNTARVDITLA